MTEKMNIVKMWEKFRRSKRQYLSLQDFIEEATVKLHFETDEDVIDALLDAKAAMALERSNSQPASSNLSIEEARGVQCECGNKATHVWNIPGEKSSGVCAVCWNKGLLETARETSENWVKGYEEIWDCEETDFAGKKEQAKGLIEELLDATSLLSYERGREEQRKEDAKIVDEFSIPEDYLKAFPNSILSLRSAFFHGWESARNYNNNVVKKNIKEKILNNQKHE